MHQRKNENTKNENNWPQKSKNNIDFDIVEGWVDINIHKSFKWIIKTMTTIIEIFRHSGNLCVLAWKKEIKKNHEVFGVGGC